jgi:hypothetical protein
LTARRQACRAVGALPAAVAAGGREQAAALRFGDPLVLPVPDFGHHQIWVCQHASIVGR